MKIAILGSGKVGRDLGLGFAGLGHEVKLGSRTPDKPEVREWIEKAGGGVSAVSYPEAAAFGELIILATPWAGTEHALQLAGHEHLEGKVVIDATNPFARKGGRLPSLALGCHNSAGEQVQLWVPKARVVKAFNQVGHELMVKPRLAGGPPDMFICGNDPEAKKQVAGILESFGWGSVDLGGIEAARLLEPLALIWVDYAILTKTRNHAFKLLRG